MTRHTIRWSLAAALLLPSSLWAQQPPLTSAARPEPLKPKNGVLKDEVGSVATVRELADGRLVLPLNRTLAVGDFKSGSITPIPSAPNGILVELEGDSTLVITSSNGWVVLNGEQPLGMLPPTNPVVAATRPVFGAGADGHLLAFSPGEPTGDSTVLWSVARQTGVRDAVTRLYYEPRVPAGTPAPVFNVDEQAALAPDGWIAVLRAHPYRMDWRAPNGEWVRGAPIQVPIIKMDQRERDAVIAQRTLSSGYGPESGVFAPTTKWPETIEPFTRGSLLLAPTGEALVVRTRSADATDTRYDVIDRHGVLVRQLELAADEGIVGFGKHSVYVRVWANKTGGRGRIERHPWP